LLTSGITDTRDESDDDSSDESDSDDDSELDSVFFNAERAMFMDAPRNCSVVISVEDDSGETRDIATPLQSFAKSLSNAETETSSASSSSSRNLKRKSLEDPPAKPRPRKAQSK